MSDSTSATTTTSSTSPVVSTTTSAEEALARAKAIAARLTGTPSFVQPTTSSDLQSQSQQQQQLQQYGSSSTTTTTTTTVSPTNNIVSNGGVTAESAPNGTATTTTAAPTERKRKRWGVAPPDTTTPTTATSTTTATATLGKDALPFSLPGLAEAALKKQKQAAAAAEITSKRIWVPTSHDKPETHFLCYLGDRLPDLTSKVKIDFNTNNGSHHHHNNNNNSASNSKNDAEEDKNRIELGGRGAGEAPLPGMPLEPMHVMIHGSEAFITVALPIVEDLLAEAERADREGPPPDPNTMPGSSSGGNSQLSYQQQPDYSTALTLTRDYHDGSKVPNTSGYRPATVAQMISQLPGGGGFFDAAGGGLGGDGTGLDLMEEIVNVPNGVVGFLIGRGGETISSMQARSGCKVQIQKEHELQPGQTNRVITLQATTQDAIDQCREMIESMVKDRIRAAGGGDRGGGSGSGGDRGGGNFHHNDRPGLGYGPSSSSTASSGATTVEAKVNDALAAGHKLVTVDVPDADVGLIIGKGGATIKSIQESTGSAIQIPPSGNVDNPTVRTISITCPTEEGAQAAKVQVENVLRSKPSYAQGGGNHQNINHNHNNPVMAATAIAVIAVGPPQVTIQVMIPDKDVGLCIGRQGCVIREMQNKTGTHIQIPSAPILGQPYRVATVTGTQEGCNQAQALMERIVQEQSSASVMGTPPPQHQHQHQQYQYQHNGGGHGHGSGHHQGGGGGFNRPHYQQHNNNNNNYAGNTNTIQNTAQSTAQSTDPAWQAYYAAQAVANKQQQEQQAAAAAAAAAEPASDAYYEQYFRYAYYYGDDAARQYYGAWSPPHGMPNPYGTNPNGISPAPVSTDGGGGGGPPATTAAAVAAPVVAVEVAPGTTTTTAVPARESSVRKVSNLPAWMTKS